MRIFKGFLIVVTAVFLFMLPITTAIYNFRTDVRTDSFNYETGVGVTTANVTLHTAIYDNDTDTVDIISDLSTDSPLYASYNTSTRVLDMTGLTASANRTLEVSYDINAMSGIDAFDTVMDWMPYFWYLLIACFPIAGLIFLIRGKGL